MFMESRNHELENTQRERRRRQIAASATAVVGLLVAAVSTQSRLELNQDHRASLASPTGMYTVQPTEFIVTPPPNQVTFVIESSALDGTGAPGGYNLETTG